jgi:hypothetical protein
MLYAPSGSNRNRRKEEEEEDDDHVLASPLLVQTEDCEYKCYSSFDIHM